MYVINIAGTANHCKIIAATMEITTSITFGRLSFKELFLNFIAIIGTLLTMIQDKNKTMPYKNHLFSKISVTAAFALCQ